MQAEPRGEVYEHVAKENYQMYVTNSEWLTNQGNGELLPILSV